MNDKTMSWSIYALVTFWILYLIVLFFDSGTTQSRIVLISENGKESYTIQEHHIIFPDKLRSERYLNKEDAKTVLWLENPPEPKVEKIIQ